MGKLESKNIEKYFTHDGKPLKTLDGIDLNVEDGEFVCIVGPSGCGKSTFLRITAGLEQPNNGQIFLVSMITHFKSYMVRHNRGYNQCNISSLHVC